MYAIFKCLENAREFAKIVKAKNPELYAEAHTSSKVDADVIEDTGDQLGILDDNLDNFLVDSGLKANKTIETMIIKGKV